MAVNVVCIFVRDDKIKQNLLAGSRPQSAISGRYLNTHPSQVLQQREPSCNDRWVIRSTIGTVTTIKATS